MAPVPENPISPRAMRPERELEPLAGRIASLVIGLTTICVFSSLLTQRVLAIKEWRSLSFVIWVVLLLYISSLLFVFTSLIFQYGFGPIENLSLCSASSLICLAGYLATKLTYLFLVDRAHICRGTTKSQLKSKLYLWNACGMLSIFAVIGIMGFVYRTYLIDDHGRCKIGVETKILIPLLIYDAVANVPTPFNGNSGNPDQKSGTWDLQVPTHPILSCGSLRNERLWEASAPQSSL
ncbi:hypothetical protein LQW54_009269 [Pestalotiopsis sp. IQ-011]